MNERGVLVSLRKTSLVDFPGKVAAAVFFPFCNLRCPWCHNGELIAHGGADGRGLVPLGDARAHIEKRRKTLGGVALSGGEPTLYDALPALILEIKRLGLSVKIDTNGTNPAMIEKILSSKDSLPDYVALDLKAAPRRYAELGGEGRSGSFAEKLAESARLIRQSGVPCEMRSIALPGGKFTEADIAALAPLAADAPWHFRAFRPGSCLDPAWNEAAPTPPETLAALAAYARSLGADAHAR